VNTTTTKNQKLFELHLEYSAAVTAHEKEYRDLEGRFSLAFGYLPIRIEDDLFIHLTEKQQDACRAFWSNTRVKNARRDLTTARSLAAAYFDAYADRSGK
jgi:hypothetical protein